MAGNANPACTERCFVMLSGCSGGGKSTLLDELETRGHRVVKEPGRRIIAEERAANGNAFPWDDPANFARRAIAMSIADYRSATGLTFFDRGIVDAAVALVSSGQNDPAQEIARYRYDHVFIVPPWPEIYENDADRRHSFDKAVADYQRVRLAYIDAGYDPVEIPRDTVEARADYVLARISAPPLPEP